MFRDAIILPVFIMMIFSAISIGFDSVRFVAKVRKVNEVDCQKMLKITDSRVEILELPWFRGFSGLIRHFQNCLGFSQLCKVVIAQFSHCASGDLYWRFS